ncbi:hypothetical protein BN77_p10231 [Rhizobium mesoamericanum STM3625]|uniref:Uncharacterized protein n=2 Tax=Rhizobium mesoamericanum TaxID=1079800 RepID=K0PYE3_9HYPH|nr:hypothetical protein BN77_p10231 [Rhizobium mesoamericanum STM3625]
MAAAGKPPHFSPLRTIDEIRRKALSVRSEDYVRGLPSDWTAAMIRDKLIIALNHAENCLRNAPPELVGILAVDTVGVPVEIYDLNTDGIVYRKATSEPEASPDLPEAGSRWGDTA